MGIPLIHQEDYIRHTFELAREGCGLVSPNPMVGAVLVKSGKIIGEGYHTKFGSAHAEVEAIANATESVEGSTLYCNLEPCCHTNKKTPPCTDLLIEKGIKKVVIANVDPNPHVAGKGVEKLLNHGIEVETGVLRKEGAKLNETFFKYIKNEIPFIHLKFAQTLDGKLSTVNGHSKWITDEEARCKVHKLRMEYDAVMVGRETLNRDNPSLTIRMDVENHGKVPYRIVVGDPNKMNLDAHLFNDDHRDKTIILSTVSMDKIVDKVQEYIREIPVVFAQMRHDSIDWKLTLPLLGQKGLASILVEGGGKLINSFLEQHSWDKLSSFIAPKILGKGSEYCFFDNDVISEAIELESPFVENFGKDICITGYRK